MPHETNWWAGWCLLLLAFLVGAVVGLSFHREDFLGGYASFRRRLLRLGHVALAALGIVNVVYGLSPWPAADRWESGAASVLWAAGGILMPAVCFATAWKEGHRALFALPVAVLLSAVVLTLVGARG